MVILYVNGLMTHGDTDVKLLGFNESVYPCSRMCLVVKVQEWLY